MSELVKTIIDSMKNDCKYGINSYDTGLSLKDLDNDFKKLIEVECALIKRMKEIDDEEWEYVQLVVGSDEKIYVQY